MGNRLVAAEQFAFGDSHASILSVWAYSPSEREPAAAPGGRTAAGCEAPDVGRRSPVSGSGASCCPGTASAAPAGIEAAGFDSGTAGDVGLGEAPDEPVSATSGASVRWGSVSPTRAEDGEVPEPVDGITPADREAGVRSVRKNGQPRCLTCVQYQPALADTHDSSGPWAASCGQGGGP